MKQNWFTGVLLIVLFPLLLTGCQLMSSLFSGEHDLALRLSTYAAVDALVEKNPEYRERIIEITGKAQTFVINNPQVNAGDIINVARQQIDWQKLTVNQIAIVETLLIVVEQEINDKIDAGSLDPNESARVLEIIGWIQEAAQRAGTQETVTL